MAATFPIQVRFLGGLTLRQQAAFEIAATRWSSIITSNLPRVNLSGEILEGLVIDAQGVQIDGPQNILGQAGPRFLRPVSRLPVSGIMQFDTADLFRLESDGSLLDVIVHEMGHVIGIGTLWNLFGLIQGIASANPVFIGRNAMQEFASLINVVDSVPVPVENTGGVGTRGGHWRESVFGNELMTGFLGDRGNPLSRLTIASLADLGYQVDISEAESYELPTMLQLAIMGIGGTEGHYQRCAMCGYRVRGTEPVILPETVLVEGG